MFCDLEGQYQGIHRATMHWMHSEEKCGWETPLQVLNPNHEVFANGDSASMILDDPWLVESLNGPLVARKIGHLASSAPNDP